MSRFPTGEKIMKRYWSIGRHQNQVYVVERIENAWLQDNDRTWKVRDFMVAYHQVKGLWPTLDEIVKHTHIARSTVRHHQQKLEGWGLLKCTHGITRSAQIVDDAN